VIAVVLVGGEGTRLRPLTFTTPKPLLPIANVPFLERQLAWLARHGVDEVVLSLGYLPDAFRVAFPGDRWRDVKLHYAVEDTPLGTGGAIRYAAELAGVRDRFVVCNGDILTDLDLGALVDFHDTRGAAGTIHLIRVADPSAFGVVPTTPEGEVLAFVEKPPPGEAPTDWVNGGTYVLEPAVLDTIATGRAVSVERETFPALLETAGSLFAFASDGYWIDIGTPEKYLRAHADVLGGRLHAAPTPTALEVAPGVWAEPDAVIEPGAHVRGPALLGAGSCVEAGAVFERSTLGAGSVVETHAVVSESVLLHEVTVGAGASVRASIVGGQAVIGGGANVSEETVVGNFARVEAGAALRGARVAARAE
jgi:NDP-sugar pyrophosphorylase family protein